MAVSSTNALKQVLFDAYGGFSDKRLKNLEKGRTFTIDDRTKGDEDATGKLFLWFGQMFVEVIDQNTVKLNMRGDIPNSALVADWFEANGSESTNFGREIIVRRGEERGLLKLAAAFRAIVRPGSRYPVRSYKYVCPRTADSLDKFSDVLSRAWQI